MKNKTLISAITVLCAVLITGFTAASANAVAPNLSEIEKIIIPQKKEPYCKLTDEEYELVCAVVDLEAGGEGEELQRAVTECILNRLDSGIWGKTISEVIYAKNQFSVVPYLHKANPSELTKSVVKDVFENGVSIPKRVMFFRTNHYHSNTWARDEMQIGNVFFSSSKWIEV